MRPLYKPWRWWAAKVDDGESIEALWYYQANREVIAATADRIRRSAGRPFTVAFHDFYGAP